ncbi:MAG TPA: C40 family peptidase [Burkholderiales bacterium]|nr:C40 family peptidase [Burkholderiales bacterium]
MRALVLVLVVLLGACSSAPYRAPAGAGSTRPSAELSDQAARHALDMVGKPYRYGGASPTGFDCSGLIMYSYRKAGLSLPHNTDRQRAMARPVRVAELRPGDLLFFNQEGKKYGHAGIYIGGSKFVHAPSSGKSVRSDRLDSPYWRRHLSEARRL